MVLTVKLTCKLAEWRLRLFSVDSKTFANPHVLLELVAPYCCLTRFRGDSGLGEWKVKSCPYNREFNEVRKECVQKSTSKRRKSLCQNGSLSVYCQPKLCSTNYPYLGGSCNWPTAGPEKLPTNNQAYLKCAPVNDRSQCGKWSAAECPQDSSFQVTAQGPGTSCPTCCNAGLPQHKSVLQMFDIVSHYSSSEISKWQLGEIKIFKHFILSGGSAAGHPNEIPNLIPCGDNHPCPSGHECRNGFCCEATMQSPLCPDGSLPGPVCYGVGQGNCVTGSLCVNGRCCATQSLPTCPDYSRSVATCRSSDTCPEGYSCENGGCCRLPQCPNDKRSYRFCRSYADCASGFYCSIAGGCCSLPLCPQGQLASSFCRTQNECGAGKQCTNSGCCPADPLPVCPTGWQTTYPCSEMGTCPQRHHCYTDNSGKKGCCPLPMCRDGQQSYTTCDALRRCPQGYGCENNVCCKLPTCPSGKMALEFCNLQLGCPPWQVCYNGGCCDKISTMPKLCPEGSVPEAACSHDQQCKSSQICYEGGCCPMTTLFCPKNWTMVGSCAGGRTCPRGQCINGVCCEFQANAGGALGKCVSGNCPLGYECIGNLCYPRRGSATSPCPPLTTAPICSCASQQACPQESFCSKGVCCATRKYRSGRGGYCSSERFAEKSPYYSSTKPGNACFSGSQCSGYPSYASCNEQRCTCINGGRSNGFVCTNLDQYLTKAPMCDNFGTLCQNYRRRKPRKRSSDEVDDKPMVNDTVLFWTSLVDTNCSTDYDCTPDTTCIRNQPNVHGCFKLLAVDMAGCTYDQQCSVATPASHCSSKGICVCDNGLYKHNGECLNVCPAGTKPNDDECLT
ncbi:unnamed protein product [Soboliphyme baturini]|uniref:EB domain-containing protein n=1 Tax=Soboliphyme baturini TaxID=241478 RepID=A0A183IKQ2_9BILA|nr:unnamed protein product [Soboliphyme baturini]